jgi:orotate phosphoribosyltransferase-like protein
MQSRCSKETNISYKYYGGRGIKCFWTSFEEFYKDMNRSYRDGLTIDRIDNNGHYCKENCRWVSLSQQALNRRTARFLTYKGKTKNLKTWADEIGISWSTLGARLDDGWTVEKALTQKLR